MTSFYRHIFLCVFCISVFASCKSVYYNTFYNAKHSYQLADQKRKESETPGSRLTPAIYRELYKRAIAKASAVLELYPKSKWVDDALLLIGKSFYWREEYRDALTKYQEIQENFPNSNLLPESIYWQGLTLWALNRTEEARFAFSFIDKEKNPELFGLANLALAEMEAESENYESAIDAYRELIAQLDKGNKLLALAWQGIGNSLQKLNRNDEALEAYQNVLKSKPETDVNFATRIQIGKTLEQQGKLNEALAAYENILKVKRLRVYEAETQLKRANVFRLKEDYLVSEETYQSVVQKYPRSKYSAEAYYNMGLMSQQVFKDLEKAKDYFTKAGREDRQSEAAEAAIQRSKDIMLLERYRLQADDAKDPQKAIVPLFNLAELYLFNLGETDSALATYQQALALSDTSAYASKALYAIGLIYADSLKNNTAARETFQNLIENYPNTPYATDARKRIALSRSDDALAEARFLEAEELKKEGVPANDYIPLLQQIANEYPKSMYAPQALFAAAWAYENELNQLDEAKTTYRQVKNDYPLTRFAEIASEKLSGDFLEPPKPKETPTDSTKTTATDSVQTTSTDTTKAASKSKGFQSAPESTTSEVLDVKDVETPPQLVFSRPPKYPDSEKEEGRPATVVVRLLIAADGTVKEAEPVSGPKTFYSAAVLSAIKYRFRPAFIGDQPQSVRMELPIVFQPPE